MNQNSNSYSHDHPYPLQQRFFIEPKTARGAIKCDVVVSDALHQKLASCLVLPYSPTSKDTTPEPARATNAGSFPSSRSSTCSPSPTGNHHSLLTSKKPPVHIAGEMNHLRSDDIGTMVWVIFLNFLLLVFVHVCVLCDESCWKNYSTCNQLSFPHESWHNNYCKCSVENYTMYIILNCTS